MTTGRINQVTVFFLLFLFYPFSFFSEKESSAGEEKDYGKKKGRKEKKVWLG
jgi:hypothetical protein